MISRLKRIPQVSLYGRHDVDVGGRITLSLFRPFPRRLCSFFSIFFVSETVNIQDTQANDRPVPSRRLRLTPRGLQRGSIHPNVSLFHNKIVMRCPDWLGSLEGSHNTSGACPRQYSWGEVLTRAKKRQEMREREGEYRRVRTKRAERARHISSLVLRGCRCVNRAHQETHAPRIVRALSSEGAPFCPP